MADNKNQHPIAPAIDEESAATTTVRSKKRKRIKLAIYIIAFVIFQTGVIVAAVETVVKFNTPEVRFGLVAVQDLTATGPTNRTSPSFRATLRAELTVRNNKNFGPYKYEASTASFGYGGVTVGSAVVPAGKASMLSAKNVDLIVIVDSSALTSTAELGGELGSDELTLIGHVRLTGKVRLMFVLKKKKSAEMRCSLTVKVSDKTVTDLKCK